MKKNNLTLAPSYYDSVAFDYDDLFCDSLSEAENKIVKHDLEKIIKKMNFSKVRILDLGCGTGLGLHLIQQLVVGLKIEIEYYGVDISSKMIQIANSKFQGSNIHFLQADMCDLPKIIVERKYDLILSLFGSFSHAEGASQLLSKILNDLINSKGVIYLMSYSRYSIKNFFSFIKTLRTKHLSFVQKYNIRNSLIDSSCKAFFYSPKIIQNSLIGSKCKITYKTLNGIFEIPIFKSLIKRLNIRCAFVILMLERTVLFFTPVLGHSLISIISKSSK